MDILIVTDAWHPQVNGVVRTLVNVIGEFERRGHKVRTVTPSDYLSVPMPTYPEIRLSLTMARSMRRLLAAAAPDAVHIATGGRPADDVALGVRDADDGVVEGALDVNDTVGDVLALALAGPTTPGLWLGHYFRTFFLPATVFFGPLRVRALVWVR